MGLAYERLCVNLEKLKLHTISEILDNYLEVASKEERSVVEILDHLMEEEQRAKQNRNIEFKMRLAGFPVRKTLEEFDFTFQPSIDKKLSKILPPFVSFITTKTLFSWVHRELASLIYQ